nr:unnamed protein product [Spirometra erinaceieuropaei]
MEKLGGNISSPEYSNFQRDMITEAMTDQDTHVRPYFCSVCNVVCSGFACYQQHLEGTRHRRNEAPSSREIMCAICNISVNSEEQLSFHQHGTKHQRRAARQPPPPPPPPPPPLSSSSTNQTSTVFRHSQLLGSSSWYHSPPSNATLPGTNTNNHASSSLTNDAGSSFLNSVDHQAPYTLSTHSSLPDLISLLPSVMDDLSSAAAAATSVCEGSRSVESASVSTPCFLTSSVTSHGTTTSLQTALQSLLQETLQEIDRLEQQLARNLARYRNSALLHRPLLAASRRRARRTLASGETAATRFSSFRLSALYPCGSSSLIRKATTSRSAVTSDLEVPPIDVEFCRHTICISLRALLNYQNGLKRTIIRIRRRCLV